MTKPIGCFTEMISPVSRRTFLAECWERQPLHIVRAAPGFYEQLLTAAEVEAAITSGGLRFPAVQLAKRGGFMPPEAFTRTLRSGADLFTGVPDLSRMRAEYAEGATIALPGFQRCCASVGALTTAIEDEFCHPVHANVYLTPPNATGFSPHFDTHEVFILQLAGRKCWTVHPPPLDLPHRSQNFDVRQYAGGEPLLKLELHPGDLLYLPRGFVHSTATSDSYSLHVTLGITVYTWVDVLTEWAQKSRGLKAFRRGLPPGFAHDPTLHASIRDEFTALLAGVPTHDDVEAFLLDFFRRIQSPRVGQRLFKVCTSELTANNFRKLGQSGQP